ncbi:formamidopyrimidine-dna glycosylase [Ophiostoma piceae UAMH 11346]|uniref:Formamidopyrimidine-dna glycosylase n=1 Tax=Ophiostoma piceae (strain UAMH 11346) TaxID=1262450 RepID=S3CUI3_OPHP1|nr:formamidopyrimidine-dna glycosylase [Ophiostoma piceae UAMH 11346]
MPEIAEAARIVHFLKAHLVGKRIKVANAIEDVNVFGKAGTTGDEVAAAFKGKKVVGAGSQGKYFWLLLDSPPHAVMHFGMTGWIHIKGMRTGYTNYYNKLKADEIDMWPPKFWKLQLETDSNPKVELAFTDPRRFGRIRLVDCPGESIRKHTPLVENGPDPVVDAETSFTEEYFLERLRKRHVPIKALLLDQAFISGIGNWVGDEVLFHSRVHPEQYCDEFSEAQMKKLYASVRYVCRTAVDLLGDSDQFPEDWLFRHRWGKGSKNEVAQLPSGEKLSFVTVGGRTSCFAPALQKKSGSLPPGIKEEPVIIKDEKPAKGAAAKKEAASKKATSTKAAPKKAPAPKKATKPAKEVKMEEGADMEVEEKEEKPGPAQKRKRGALKAEAEADEEVPPVAPATSKKKIGKAAPAASKKAKTTPAEEKVVVDTGRRRSTRLTLR